MLLPNLPKMLLKLSCDPGVGVTAVGAGAGLGIGIGALAFTVFAGGVEVGIIFILNSREPAELNPSGVWNALGL